MKGLDIPKAKPSRPTRKAPPRYVPKTLLGKRLWALRQKYIAGGGKLLDWDELEAEIARSKGQAD